MNKKGFTLVELLAVIVILAVILVIAIPQITNTIKASRLGAMESSAKMIARNAEEDYLAQQTLNPNYSASSIPCTNVAKLSDDYDLSTCSVTYNASGKATVNLKGATGKKFDGMTCRGTKDNMNCSVSSSTGSELVTGTATIKVGRLFSTFADTTTTAVVAATSEGWTIQLTADGNQYDNRDYQVNFSTPLPSTSKLTLVVIGTNGTNSYYYKNLTEEVSSIKFSDFTKMGTASGNPPEYSATSSDENETFLINSQFTDAPVGSDISVTFDVLKLTSGGEVEDTIGVYDDDINRTSVSYNIFAQTIGVISSTSTDVTISTSPSDDPVYVGQNVYLIGQISGPGISNIIGGKVAKLDNQTATWIAGDKFAFELGTYGSTLTGGTFSFTGLSTGEYSVEWGLYANNTPENSMNRSVSNKVTSTFNWEAPRLSVTVSPNSRFLTVGVAATRTFTYTTNRIVSFYVEKSVSGEYVRISDITLIDNGDGTVTATFPSTLSSGNYLIAFSIDGDALDNSPNDNVNFSYNIS